MRRMNEISKKVGSIIFFLCVSLCLLQNTSRAAKAAKWANDEIDYKRNTFASYYNWKTRKTDEGKHLILERENGENTRLILNFQEKENRKFSKDPLLDRTQGLYCLQHRTEDLSKPKHKIRKNIRVTEQTKTYNIDLNSNAEAKDCKTAAQIAYILSDTTKTVGKKARGDHGAQGALWLSSKEYYEAFVSDDIDDGFWSDIKDGDGNEGDWAKREVAKKKYNEAQAYSSMSIKNTTFTTSSYSTWKSYGNDYIIGPFRVTYTDFQKEGIKFAGQYKSTFNGSTLKFCDVNGNDVTVKDNTPFYIRVPKSSASTGGNFKFNARRLNVIAEWWDIKYATNAQDHLYLGYAYRQYITQGAEVNVAPPSLQIIKTDAGTARPIQGMEFKIKNASGYYLTSMPSNGLAVFGSTNASQAMTFTTDARGQINIPRIETGTYTIIETGVGNNSQYEAAGEMKTVTINKAGVTPVPLTNKKAFINLSGYVWEDIHYEPSKEGESNGLYQGNNNDNKDKLLENVTVKLMKNSGTSKTQESFKDSKGNLIREIKTDKNGKYKLYGIRIDDLDKLSIEFTYNGMSYTNVKPQTSKPNGSKATETVKGNSRNEYNERYTNIVPGGATNSKGSKTTNLNYHTKDYESTMNYGKNSVYGYQGQEFPINGTDTNFLIQATTQGTYDLRGGETVDQIRASGKEEIPNINLGLWERIQPQLNISKDINSAKVSINGAEHIYQYGDQTNNSDRMKKIYEAIKNQTGNTYTSPYEVPPKVKFETPYANMSYERALYPSDVYYEAPKNQEDKNLRVKVIYQIGVLNQASGLKTIVNEIDDYYDSKYIKAEGANKTKIKVGRKIDAKTGEVSQEGNDKIEYELQPLNNADYYKIHIKNINLEAGKSKRPEEGTYIYIQLEIEKDQIKQIVTENEDDNKNVKLDNIAEIASYSVKDKNNAIYAGIDKKSAPGNVNLTNQKTYEADTDKAPGLKLVLGEERKTSGKVFIDKVKEDNKFNPNGVNHAQVRQGNGSYDNGEVGIEGVTVELVYPNKTEAKTYQKDKNEWRHVKATTNDQGEFSIEGFIPDQYILKYTWGGQEYYVDSNQKEKIRVQDYKGTIYNEPNREKEKGLEWYKLENRYSDAKDNYETRTSIDKQSSMITNSNKEVIKKYEENSQIKVEKDNVIKTEKLIRTMDSYTPEFRVNLEYELNPTNGGKEHTNHLENMDFGIVERAKQQLELNKNITRTKVILSNGNLLIDAKIDDGELKDVKYATYMPRASNEGQLKLEVDNEILQNAVLEIEYELKVRNTSELDYNNEEFYWYGEGYGENENNLVELNANTVIDYLDNNLSNNQQTENSGTEWKTYTTEEKKELTKTGNETLNGLLAENLKAVVSKINTIMETKTLGKKLKPKGDLQETSVKLKAYKMLPSVLKEEDTNFGNDAEIIKVTKTGGSTLTTTPGSYNLSEAPKEVDEATAETVTIVPPTGLDINVIAYTLLAISSLGILTAGIILIRKLVLK